MPLEGETFAGKHLAASFEYPGREPRMPDGFKLLLKNVVTKPSGVEEEDGELVITVDGMELLKAEARYLGANERVPAGLPLLYGAKIPVEALIAISRSKWYVKMIYMTTTTEPGLNYESKWATLTFELR